MTNAACDKQALRQSLKLYLCTDRALLGADNSLQGNKILFEAVEAAVSGGVTIVQLREKTLCSRDFFLLAKELLGLCTKLDVPLIINDRLDIALALGAAGVHLGQDDIPLAAARTICGKNFIIGVSCHNLEQAIKAEQEGADYIGAGAVFATGTKADTSVIGTQELSNIAACVKIPVIGIGGINKTNIAQVKASGAIGAAVISAILSQRDADNGFFDNIKNAAMELSSILDRPASDRNVPGKD